MRALVAVTFFGAALRLEVSEQHQHPQADASHHFLNNKVKRLRRPLAAKLVT
jgi:hypothetical protein